MKKAIVLLCISMLMPALYGMDQKPNPQTDFVGEKPKSPTSKKDSCSCCDSKDKSTLSGITPADIVKTTS